MDGDEENAAFLRLRGLEMFPACEIAKEVVNGQPAFVAPEIGQLESELREEFACGDAGRLLVTVQGRKDILVNDSPAGRRAEPVGLGEMNGEPARGGNAACAGRRKLRAARVRRSKGRTGRLFPGLPSWELWMAGAQVGFRKPATARAQFWPEWEYHPSLAILRACFPAANRDRS